jgi:hypothetical protein
MFQVGDRVKTRYPITGCSDEGTVVAITGKWIHVKHDFGSSSGGAVTRVSPRFDYHVDELEHLNPLLKFASEV